MQERAQDKKEESGLIDKLRSVELKDISKDVLLIFSGTTLLAFLTGVRSYFSSHDKLVSLIESGNLYQTFLSFLDGGAGIFAGINDRYSASLIVYGATLIPEFLELYNGDASDVARRVLIKTFLYGASYGLGRLFRSE